MADDTEQQNDSAIAAFMHARTAHVHVLHGALRGVSVEVPSGGLTIGRADCGELPSWEKLFLPDRKISRQHVELRRTSGGWRLKDLASRNQGFVNGKPFRSGERVPLGDGAVIRMGNSLLIYREGSASPAAAPLISPVEGEAFPGRSPAAAAVRQQLERLARATGHVLILGETGTGKERVARSLAVEGRPFIPQNCAELRRELARSELFGHARGAFSGAHAPKLGLVELASGGVLFLDEVGELELDVQGELLRFLEDGTFRPVGANELRHCNARVVAATNVDLELAVQQRRFRRDLLARLRAANRPLELPALRRRLEDVWDWTQHFAAELAQPPQPPLDWTVGALECLLLYPWPDNLRELRGFVHGVVRGLLAGDLELPISPDDLPEPLRAHRRALRGGSEPPTPVLLMEKRAEEPSRIELEAALSDCGGRVRTAALQLRIDRRKMYRLCEKHEIDVDRYRSLGDEGASPS